LCSHAERILFVEPQSVDEASLAAILAHELGHEKRKFVSGAVPEHYIPEIRRAEQVAPVGSRGQIRRGLPYMLLAAVIYYFAGGYSTTNVPFPINLSVGFSPT
jgi:hypothetical protein